MTAPRTKVIFVVAIVTLLLVGTSVFILLKNIGLLDGKAPNLAGSWAGALQVQNNTLRLVLHISDAADGTYTASMDSIDQGATAIPVTSLLWTNRSVLAELRPLRAAYNAKPSKDGKELSGTWQQGGGSFPLVLRRTLNPPTVPPPIPETAFVRREGSDLQGYWKGTLETGEADLRLVLKIAEAADGKFTARLDSLDQGARNIPVSSMSYTRPALEFEVGSINGFYQGDLNDQGTAIDGTWTQDRLGSVPLLLTRVTAAEAAAKVPDAIYAPATASDLQGSWRGVIDAGGTKLRLVLNIGKTTNGTFVATLDSLDQGAKDLPAASVTQTNDEVEVRWPALRAIYQGTLADGKLTGTWQQGRGSLPLIFERTNQMAGAKQP